MDVKLVACLGKCLDDGATKENYVRFFHNLLWYEETIVRINLKKYNMSEVPLKVVMPGYVYSLLVPGLAEKRPSLLVGDLLFIKPSNTDEEMFEGVISEINHNTISINGLHQKFGKHYSAEARFDVRFFLSRMSLERMHMAVDSVFRHGFEDKVFPKRNPKAKPLQDNLITEFYNSDVGRNPEQRAAVNRILHAAGSPAPYLLHGPPGTGKTRTLTEAALQLVARNKDVRVLICTDSNMAADHVAVAIAEYADKFPANLLLRASSKYRVWETLPKNLYKYSNGTSARDYENVSTEKFRSYRIVVTTLLHSAKFVR
ncbi:hypothetical protein evm_006275 [Chilo suppressalis]|nr:hypothetical protein evm_006275 [Chilo suppressalis]